MSASTRELIGRVMNDSSPNLRYAIDTDFAEIAEIYAHYVLNGLASFEITPPDADELTTPLAVYSGYRATLSGDRTSW